MSRVASATSFAHAASINCWSSAALRVGTGGTSADVGPGWTVPGGGLGGVTGLAGGTARDVPAVAAVAAVAVAVVAVVAVVEPGESAVPADPAPAEHPANSASSTAAAAAPRRPITAWPRGRPEHARRVLPGSSADAGGTAV